MEVANKGNIIKESQVENSDIIINRITDQDNMIASISVVSRDKEQKGFTITDILLSRKTVEQMIKYLQEQVSDVSKGDYILRKSFIYNE